MTTTIENIGRDQLVPSPTNPRKQFNKEKLQELAETIRAHGILEPLLVRQRQRDAGPHHKRPNGAPVYEIIAGERRWRASELAKLKELPCIVKDLSDGEILEIQYIENLQRQDLSAIEEAEGFAKLLAEGLYTAESLAKKLGKSRSHIFGRLKLTKLTGQVRKALDAGQIPHTIAELLSRVPKAFQDGALSKVIKGEYGYGGPMSFRDAKAMIDRTYSRDVSKSPWIQAAESDEVSAVEREVCQMTGAPACASCPRRSENCREEFPDIKGPNVCTDTDCFERKRIAYRALVLAQLAKEGKRTITPEENEAILGPSRMGPWMVADEHLFAGDRWDALEKVLPKIGVKGRWGLSPEDEAVELFSRAEVDAALVKAGLVDPEEVEDDVAAGFTAEDRERFAAERAKEEAARALEHKVRTTTDSRVEELAIEKLKDVTEMELLRLVLAFMCSADLPKSAVQAFGLAGLQEFPTAQQLLGATKDWPLHKLRNFAAALCAFEPYEETPGLLDPRAVGLALRIPVAEIETAVREELAPVRAARANEGKPNAKSSKSAKGRKSTADGADSSDGDLNHEGTKLTRRAA